MAYAEIQAARRTLYVLDPGANVSIITDLSAERRDTTRPFDPGNPPQHGPGPPQHQDLVNEEPSTLTATHRRFGHAHAATISITGRRAHDIQGAAPRPTSREDLACRPSLLAKMRRFQRSP